MKKHQLTLCLAAFLMLITASCSGSATEKSLEDAVREAEAAIAKGDMQAAQSAAANIFDDPNLSTSQMGRLSMVYMQLADSLDQVTNTDRATDLLDKAYKFNADSARLFYQTIEPERMQYVEAMEARLANRNHPVDMSTIPNEEMADSDLTTPLP